LDGLTRVASCHRLLQTLMLHYFAMERYYCNDMFTGMWDAIIQGDWVLIQENESLTFMLVNYALGESQMDKVAASIYIYILGKSVRSIANEIVLMLCKLEPVLKNISQSVLLQEL
jgi:hypothetical protein